MERCVDSLLAAGADAEIIIVDDGSEDETGEIADGYARRYPDIVRVIHKENGGHGSAVNAGLNAASGTYFKVVDSDDWLAYEALIRIMEAIRGWDGFCPDLLICDYTYNHLEEGVTKRISYRNVFPVDTVFTWDEIGVFRPYQYLIMHALIYRTDVLRQSGVVLPEHTFYVDNLFAYCPLPYVKTLFYMDENLYQYYLGREDQSVNERVLMGRIGQHMKVTKLVAESVDLDEVKKESPRLASYMCRNISIMMAISSIHLLIRGDEQARQWFLELWSDIRRKNPKLYYRLRFTKLCGFTNLPGSLGKKISIQGYRIAKGIYKFQ